jgi:hypothetical protein
MKMTRMPVVTSMQRQELPISKHRKNAKGNAKWLKRHYRYYLHKGFKRVCIRSYSLICYATAYECCQKQLKQAMEENRDARRSAAHVNKPAAVAFEIDLGGNSPAAMSKAPVLRSVRQSEEKLTPPGAGGAGAGGGRRSNAGAVSAGAGAGGPVRSRSNSVRDEKDCGDSAGAGAGAGVGAGVGGSTESASSKAKKGWGPPVATGEIAKGVVRHHSDYASASPHRMFAPDRQSVGGGGGGSNRHERNFSRESFGDAGAGAGAGSVASAGAGDSDADLLDGGDSVVGGDGEDQVVLRRLESKRNSQLQARQQAKEVFKKLREKRRKESESRGSSIGFGAGAAPVAGA